MTKRSRYIAVLAIFAAALLALVFFISRDGQNLGAQQNLPDGSVVTLTGVQTGTNAVFLHATLWDKIKSRLLPTRGLRFAGRTFKPPAIDVISAKSQYPSLFLEFKFEGFTNIQNPLLPAGFIAGIPIGTGMSANGNMYSFCNVPAESLRVVVAGDDAFEFANPFRGIQSNAYFTISLPYYARQSKNLKIRFEHRNLATSPWQTMAQFTAHATPAPERIWKAESLPARRMLGTNEFILSEVSAIPSRTVAEDSGKYAARFDFHLSGTNERATRVMKFTLQDSGGNQLTPDRSLFWDVDAAQNFTAHIYPAPDPRKLWRIRAEIRTFGPPPATNTVEFFVKPNFKQ